MECQGDLSLRQGDSTAHIRPDAVKKKTMKQYFALLHDTLSTHDLLNKPDQHRSTILKKAAWPLTIGHRKWLLLHKGIPRKISTVHRVKKANHHSNLYKCSWSGNPSDSHL